MRPLSHSNIASSAFLARQDNSTLQLMPILFLALDQQTLSNSLQYCEYSTSVVVAKFTLFEMQIEGVS